MGQSSILSPIAKKAIEETGSKLLASIYSLSNHEKMAQAVRENFALYEGFLIQYAMEAEKRYKERTGRDFHELPEEDVAQVAKLTAGATFEVASEVDPERLRMLAAAMIGTVTAIDTDEGKSAVWKAVRQLDPESVRLLVFYVTEVISNFEEVFEIEVEEFYKGEPDKYEERGCKQLLYGLGLITTRTGASSSQGSYGPEPNVYIHEEISVSERGIEVIRALLLYLDKATTK